MSGDRVVETPRKTLLGEFLKGNSRTFPSLDIKPGVANDSSYSPVLTGWWWLHNVEDSEVTFSSVRKGSLMDSVGPPQTQNFSDSMDMSLE